MHIILILSTSLGMFSSQTEDDLNPFGSQSHILTAIRRSVMYVLYHL